MRKWKKEKIVEKLAFTSAAETIDYIVKSLQKINIQEHDLGFLHHLIFVVLGVGVIMRK